MQRGGFGVLDGNANQKRQDIGYQEDPTIGHGQHPGQVPGVTEYLQGPQDETCFQAFAGTNTLGRGRGEVHAITCGTPR